MSVFVGFVSQAQMASGQLEQLLRAAPESVWLVLWGASLLFLSARTRRAASKAPSVRLSSATARVAPAGSEVEATC
jgi:hypothetical protein